MINLHGPRHSGSQSSANWYGYCTATYRINEEVDHALRGTFAFVYQYRVGERQWAMGELARCAWRVVSKLDAARQSLHVVLRGGGRLRGRHVRSRRRSLCGGYYRRQGRTPERHANRGADPENEMGPG